MFSIVFLNRNRAASDVNNMFRIEAASFHRRSKFATKDELAQVVTHAVGEYRFYGMANEYVITVHPCLHPWVHGGEIVKTGNNDFFIIYEE